MLVEVSPNSEQPALNSEANAIQMYKCVTPCQLATPRLYKQLHSLRQGVIFLHHAKGKIYKMCVKPT